MTPFPGLLERLVRDLPGMAYRCLHDADWTLEFVSAGSFELLGYRPDQLLGPEPEVKVVDLVHPEDLAGVSLSVERSLTQREPYELRYRMRTAAGEIKHIQEVGRGVFGEGGELLALEGFLTDVTESARAERALSQRGKQEALGQLAGGIAHDFNNLLTVIMAAAGLLEETLEPGSAERSHAGTIAAAGQQAARLTRQLLTFARPLGASPHPIDAVRVLSSQLPTLRQLTGAEVRLELELPEAPVLISLPPVGLEQVLLNLVSNARDACQDGGTIRVTLRQEGERVHLEVSDDGVGLSPEQQERVFDAYYTTKGGRGTGLGLAVVRQVLEAAAGTVELESSLGAGTTIRISLPSARSGEVRPEYVKGKPMGTETLLLVEDDDAVRETLAQGLRRLGYVVLESANGQRALELSARHKGPIDALITDGKMPLMGGVELAGRFAAQRPDVPVILITGDSVSAPPGLFAASRHKPVTAADLAALVREQLDGAAGE